MYKTPVLAARPWRTLIRNQRFQHLYYLENEKRPGPEHLQISQIPGPVFLTFLFLLPFPVSFIFLALRLIEGSDVFLYDEISFTSSLAFRYSAKVCFFSVMSLAYSAFRSFTFGIRLTPSSSKAFFAALSGKCPGLSAPDIWSSYPRVL